MGKIDKQTSDISRAPNATEPENKGLLPLPVPAELLTAAGDTITLKTCWTKIGRQHDNDLALASDDYVSRYHAWITFEENKFWLEDLGSTNGTWLNDQPVERRYTLSSGDKIRIGKSALTFVLLGKTS